uniref:Pept_C1 domain-containing protein n=1 Tax=Caenorhabditis japonica TaxID=281687 RepID=A0A8R1HTA7_CAEJA
MVSPPAWLKNAKGADQYNKLIAETRDPRCLEEARQKRALDKLYVLGAKVTAIILILTALMALCMTFPKYFPFYERTSKISAVPDVGMQTIAQEYIAFTEKYNKSYATSQESLKRVNAYYVTKANIENWNKEKEHGSAEYGHNDLSDWTDDEFQKTLLPMSFYQRLHKEAEFIKPIPASLANMKGEQASPFPDFFDWRDRNVVTPVKAQGQCGSCWAFASTATVEAAYAIAHGEKRNLSEQTLLDCDLVDNACDGGDEDKAFRYIHRQGLAYAVDLPYVAHRQNGCAVNDHWNTTKIEAAYFLHHDEDSIIHWLVNFGPVNIGMAVIQPMRAYKGGVFTPSEYACKNEVIGLHALLITGYGTSDKGEKYWIVKNSWGNTWGVEHGYIYFARGINACGIEDEPIGILA